MCSTIYTNTTVAWHYLFVGANLIFPTQSRLVLIFFFDTTLPLLQRHCARYTRNTLLITYQIIPNNIHKSRQRYIRYTRVQAVDIRVIIIIVFYRFRFVSARPLDVRVLYWIYEYTTYYVHARCIIWMYIMDILYTGRWDEERDACLR